MILVLCCQFAYMVNYIPLNHFSLQLQLPRRLSDLTTGEMKERRHPRFCQIFPANQIIMKPRPKPQLLALVFSLCVTVFLFLNYDDYKRLKY